MLYSNEVLARAEAGAVALIAIGLAAEQMYCSAIGTVHHECEWAFAGDRALFELDLSRQKFDDLSVHVKASINHL